jgi:hypothetical protein
MPGMDTAKTQLPRGECKHRASNDISPSSRSNFATYLVHLFAFPHSYLSATIGSTRIARRAGK